MGKTKHSKPKLSIDEQIAHLEDKGVRFELCDKEAAANYLTERNNFLRLASYRFLFAKQMEGKEAGKYLHLDFAYLVDLASIDRLLRATMLPITLDIEHAAKLKLLRIITEDDEEDGYRIVMDFINSLPHSYRQRLTSELNARSNSERVTDVYAGDLIKKYQEDMPVWVFLEVVSFGTFISFYRFCARRWEDDDLLMDYYALKEVKNMRNACAHNSCVINGFSKSQKSSYQLVPRIYDKLNEAGMKKSKSRNSKLQNPRMQHFVTTLYAAQALTSDQSKARNGKSLEALKSRITKSMGMYKNNESIRSFLEFSVRLIDIFR